MQIGAMNHPAKPLDEEVAWMKRLELDFIDLTLEPPVVAAWQVKAQEVKALIEEAGLGVVGHTAYYLPIGSSFESLRRAAIDELKKCIEKFATIGARWVNVHPDGHAPFVEEDRIMARNVDSLRELTTFARSAGLGMMVENVPGRFNSARQLSGLLDPLPELGLHMDIGHCNLGVEHNTTEEVLERYASRLAHVHLHDNRGGHNDLHLALGMGNMDIPRYVRALKRSGYDGTITLEVFSPDPHYLEHSRDRLREWWVAD